MERLKPVREVFWRAAGEAARARHNRLVQQTNDALRTAGLWEIGAGNPDPYSAFLAMADPRTRVVAGIETLRAAWTEWQAEFERLLELQPRVELYYMLESMSESHDASSWPAGWERKISDWVVAGNFARPPLDDRHGIVTPDFFNRLKEVRRRCGGWLYYDDSQGVVFVTEDEWRRHCAAEDDKERRRKSEQKKEQDLYRRARTRLRQLVLEARQDQAFWAAFRAWELARESNPPAREPTLRFEDLPPLEVGQSWIASPVPFEELRQRGQIPVDPIFRDFMTAHGEPGDLLSPGTIVVALREAVRKSLGFDNPFVVLTSDAGLGTPDG